jgi:hypothetical protein
MSQIERFTREAGAVYGQSVEDPDMYVLGNPVPEWVYVPEDLGGCRLAVTGHREITCPCGQHRTRELQLGAHEGGTLCVAECEGQGFLWYRRQPCRPR